MQSSCANHDDDHLPETDALGLDVRVIHRDGLRILRICRSSWHQRFIHEYILGPCSLTSGRPMRDDESSMADRA